MNELTIPSSSFYASAFILPLICVAYAFYGYASSMPNLLKDRDIQALFYPIPLCFLSYRIYHGRMNIKNVLHFHQKDAAYYV
jgi:hypothetical protein